MSANPDHRISYVKKYIYFTHKDLANNAKDAMNQRIIPMHQPFHRQKERIVPFWSTLCGENSCSIFYTEVKKT